MLNTDLSFKRGNQKYKFHVRHNLDEFELSIDYALINWICRTKDFSVESFCKYVKSKDETNLICEPFNF